MIFVRARVIGDERVRRAFREVRLKSSDLSAAWSKIGGAIKRDAIPLAPTKTGALVRSIRAGKSKSRAIVRAGSKRVVYAGIQNYGGMASGSYGPHWIEPKHFLNKALESNRGYAEDEFQSEIEHIIRRAGF